MITFLRIPNGDTKLFEMAFHVRTIVFVNEQQVDTALEMDEYDAVAQHYLALEDNKPIATARWRHTDNGIKLERFAVIAEYRNNGTGSKILEIVLQDVVPFQKPIYLHSQLKAINFYKRHGFIKEGNIFTEANIEHYKMHYKK